jgi:hypothetical protein
MNPVIPFFVSLIFMATTLLTLWLFSRLDEDRSWITWTAVIWLLIQGIVTWTGFYLVTDSLPPRFALLAGPPVLFVILVLILPSTRKYLLTLSLEKLTWIHTVRIPVELVLYWLYMCGQIPKLMTFEGVNYDIFSGITAPFIIYFGLHKGILSNRTLIMWNILCLALLINIVAHAIMAAPSPFQQIAFDQPNRGILYFPFSWLPGFIVPVVFFSHLVSLMKLFSEATVSGQRKGI